MTDNKGNSTIGSVIEIPLDQLSIGKSQVRVNPNKGIDDLAQSIKAVGLLEPIVVKKRRDSQYEILTGQRRFLAHRLLGYEKILAVVLDREVDENECKVISLTENLLREDLSLKEKIDACTSLYKRYGSFKLVAEETGLSQRLVREYVKYDQLIPELKKMVDDGKSDVRLALQAQRAAETTTGDVDPDAAVKFAQELAPMSGVQRKQFIKAAEDDPDASAEEKIEKGRQQPQVRQIVVTIGPELHQRLRRYAEGEDMNQDEAAAQLIEMALKDL